MKRPRNVCETVWTPVISLFQQLLFQRCVKSFLSYGTKQQWQQQQKKKLKELYSYEMEEKITDSPPCLPHTSGLPETNVFPGEGGTRCFYI